MQSLNADDTAPSGQFAAVAPNDATNLPRAARSLFVGGAGNLAIMGADGVVVTFNNIPAGSILPLRTARVMATNTTAGNIVALL